MGTSKSGWFGFMAAASGGSLFLCGLASFLLSLILWSLPGLLIGAALMFHGVYELSQRKRLLVRGEVGAARKMAWNQVALAASVSLYMAWQIHLIDRAALTSMMHREPMLSLLELYPQGAADMLERDLPLFVTLFYGIVLAVAVVSCLGMAFYYRIAGERVRSAS